MELTGSLFSESMLVIGEYVLVFKEFHLVTVEDMFYHFTAHRGQVHRAIICRLALVSLLEYIGDTLAPSSVTLDRFRKLHLDSGVSQSLICVSA